MLNLKSLGVRYAALIDRFYPPLVCLLVLLGHFSGKELIFGAINVLLFSFSLWILDSAKHSLIFFGTFLYQVSPGHEPTIPSSSDSYFEDGHLVLIVILAVILLGSFAAYVIRTKAYLGISFESCSLLIPMLVLAAALILNGIFSNKHTSNDFWLGTAEAAAFFFFFFLPKHPFFVELSRSFLRMKNLVLSEE